jgi:ABC-type uncharacterized transport system involved in gliding motility auxiliary subunit
VALTRREDLAARSGVDLGRMARRGAGSLVYTAVVLGAMALAVGVAARFRTTWDFTAQHTNSLAPKTVEALAGLADPVSIWALFKERDIRRESYWELLQSYRRRSDKVRVEFVDPNTRPGIVQTLGLSKEEQSALKDGLTVVTRGPRKVVFRGREEEDVTNALLEVGADERRVVGFIRGAGESDPASTADAGVSSFVEALRHEYYEVVDVRLDAPIPGEVNVLVAAGPRNPIPKADLDRLAAWLDRGGRLLALLDPEFDSGIGEVAARWGLRPKEIKVFDRAQGLRGESDVPLATDFSRHPIVRGFSASLPLAFPLPVAVEDFEPGDPRVFHEFLVRSSRNSEGLTPQGTREGGPFTLAAASYKTLNPGAADSGETRVVLVGDVAFASNAFLPEQANRDFALNSVGWLARAKGFVAVRERTKAGQEISMRRGDFRIFRLIVAAPSILVIAAGLAVFLRRRGL